MVDMEGYRALEQAAGADSATEVAALLHDIGHLLDKRGEDAAERGIDTRHEVLGAQWLERYFGTAVSEPVRWHVDAKRYLCATQPDYYEKLTEASKTTLKHQVRRGEVGRGWGGLCGAWWGFAGLG